MYSYFLNRGSWDNALSHCRQQGGTLPFIASQAENVEVYEAAARSAGGECTDNFRHFWIGITDQVVSMKRNRWAVTPVSLDYFRLI